MNYYVKKIKIKFREKQPNHGKTGGNNPHKSSSTSCMVSAVAALAQHGACT
jgi:hypothetical protein